MNLDVGCGTKKNVATLGFDIRRVQGVDVVGDAHCLPFKNDSFQHCVACNMLEHVADPLRVLTETRRVLIESGTLTLLVPMGSRMFPMQVKMLLLLRWRELQAIRHDLRKGEHKWQFTKKNLHALLTKAGFRSRVEFKRYHHLPFYGNIMAEATK